ncbi:PAS domain S-box protein [Flavobacterium sp. 14A]|uniref:PAS domain S-box protein n=1 Tax=Flavobacterium sp. 14A TaxID=2735896 RepID=UPI00156EB188|nr:PAS domain S-box protein [Flavobacterium sp. 14A]NRT13042.1 PAS domain S-box-containing protein [Flavobacterium sp. 14A]
MIEAVKTYAILVIEDNEVDYGKIRQLLKEANLVSDVRHAANFSEAATILSSSDKFFDVVLLSPTLPDIAMDQVVAEVVELVYLCPIIAVVPHKHIDFALDSIKSGISDYLVKEELEVSCLHKSIICAIERKKIFFSYELAKSRYSDLFHLSPLPMWVYDLGTFRFLDVNKAAIEKYGFSKEEFLEMTTKEIRPPEDYHLFDDEVNSFDQYKDNLKQRYVRHQSKEGDIIDVEIQSNLIFFDNQRAKLVMANDITKHIQHIATIEAQNKSLKDIAWTHSHVIRAPLAKMMSIVDFMIESKMVPLEYEHLLSHFFESGKELDTIIRAVVKKTETINKINSDEL